MNHNFRVCWRDVQLFVLSHNPKGFKVGRLPTQRVFEVCLFFSFLDRHHLFVLRELAYFFSFIIEALLTWTSPVLATGTVT